MCFLLLNSTLSIYKSAGCSVYVALVWALVENVRKHLFVLSLACAGGPTFIGVSACFALLLVNLVASVSDHNTSICNIELYKKST